MSCHVMSCHVPLSVSLPLSISFSLSVSLCLSLSLSLISLYMQARRPQVSDCMCSRGRTIPNFESQVKWWRRERAFRSLSFSAFSALRKICFAPFVGGVRSVILLFFGVVGVGQCAPSSCLVCVAMCCWTVPDLKAHSFAYCAGYAEVAHHDILTSTLLHFGCQLPLQIH